MVTRLFPRVPLLLGLFITALLGQACGDAANHTIQIDFSEGSDVLAGAQVVIDGVVVGELQPGGAAASVSFKVTAGNHSLELRKEGYESQAFEIVGAAAEGTTSLTAKPATWFTDGQLKHALVLSR